MSKSTDVRPIAATLYFLPVETRVVQDLTNPMLAQVPHCLLAAHVGTIMGVETNGLQFYPEASLAEAVASFGG